MVNTYGKGELQNEGGGGASEVLPLQKRGGGRKGFSHDKEGRGGTISVMVVLAQELEVLAIVIVFWGGEMGAQQFSNPVLRGGG